MANEVLIQFEEIVGIKQQLDDLDRRIKINANNISAIRSELGDVEQKLKQIDPNMIKQNFQNVNALKDSVGALQKKIDDVKSSVVDISRQLSALAANVRDNSAHLDDLFRSLDEQSREIDHLNAKIRDIYSVLNLSGNIFIDDKHSTHFNSVYDMLQSFKQKNANNPFYVMRRLMSELDGNVFLAAKQYVDQQLSEIRGKVDGYSNNFNRIIGLQSQFNDMKSQIAKLQYKIDTMPNSYIDFKADITNLKSIVAKINNAVVSHTLNFKDIMKIDKAFNNYISKITVPSPRKVSEFFKIDALGIPVSAHPPQKPYVNVSIYDGSWHSTKYATTYMPIATMLSYVNQHILDRVSKIATYNGANPLNYIRRQLFIITSLISGTFDVIRQLTIGRKNVVYKNSITTVDGTSAQVYFEIDNVYLSDIQKIMDSFAVPHLQTLAGGLNNIVGAFSTMKVEVPSSFNLRLPLNLNLTSDELNNPVNITMYQNIVANFNAFMNEMKTTIANLQKDVENIKNTLKSLRV